ncbi:hypothetical protein BDK51DRAFT_32352 [Blyttiomyces helicus]|uniref:Uncharacterized protein n=1 Tax=Blyttiomyces helicus TaxID=388810 RepID=A0A4P9WIW6_9FUNG|nr:hypothetical protein BDK51DRAFT_32352 [Blyttiomyces helicus]|eukprot:RKO92754.1 hypothetical protein BDK51DRAFT_32352 [Blyttiomyces helicus]
MFVGGAPHTRGRGSMRICHTQSARAWRTGRGASDKQRAFSEGAVTTDGDALCYRRDLRKISFPWLEGTPRPVAEHAVANPLPVLVAEAGSAGSLLKLLFFRVDVTGRLGVEAKARRTKVFKASASELVRSLCAHVDNVSVCTPGRFVLSRWSHWAGHPILMRGSPLEEADRKELKAE